MGYDIKLVDKIRKYLLQFSTLKVAEKKMFRGLTFMVNGKMCVSVSGENLMCRFDPDVQQEVDGKKGFRSMIMKGKELKGFCYIAPTGFKSKKEFEYWINLCLVYNERAKSSKNKNKK